jgi:hypothetical protein
VWDGKQNDTVFVGDFSFDDKSNAAAYSTMVNAGLTDGWFSNYPDGRLAVFY